MLKSLLLTFFFCTSAIAAPHYSLLLRHGKVIDGAGNGWFYADVAIDKDRIAAIGDLSDATADREIDATNLIVAPGFIDVHTHADEDLYKQPRAENFTRDGVTTIVTGNCGYSVKNVAEYFDHLKAHGSAINVATLMGHNTVIRQAKGDSGDAMTPEQMSKAKSLVEQAMKDGAVGFSTGLIYTPGKYSPTQEIIDLATVSAKFGGIYTSHMRNESTQILSAIDEALRVGREAHCRVEISHFKLPSDVAAKIGGAQTTLGKVMAARAAGQEVWVDQYPYTASSTTVTSMLPDYVYEKGAANAKMLLADPEQVAHVLQVMRKEHEIDRGRKDLSYAVVASCQAHPNYNGLSIKQIAQLRKAQEKPGDGELLSTAPQPAAPVTMEDQYRAIIAITLDGGASCVFHSMDEKEVEDILKCPLVSICSDSGVRQFGVGMPHPRGYGSNARILGRYVRERHAITLEDAIRRMTTLPATAFRLKDRGELRVGNFADVVVFSADTVKDNATFESPHQFSTGYRAVIVNGKVVVDNDETTEALPGTPIYGPGAEKRD
jgi:N-acyl-D-amino-acid deacylase